MEGSEVAHKRIHYGTSWGKGVMIGIVVVICGLVTLSILASGPQQSYRITETERKRVEASWDNSSHASMVATSTGNVAHNRLLKSDANTRASELGVMVASSGDACRGKDAFFMGLDPKDNGAYWSVRCTNGKSYEVAIEANATGSTSVIDCGFLKAIAKVSCFVKLDQQ